MSVQEWIEHRADATVAARDVQRWSEVIRTVGYVVVVVYAAVGLLVLLAGLSSGNGGQAVAGIVGGVLAALLGVVIAAPLLAFGSYLVMRSHIVLADLIAPDDED